MTDFSSRPGRSAWSRSALFLALAAFVLVLAPSRARAQAAVPREYQLKAVFLFNFLQFVEWPPSAFQDEAGPIRIGILGDDPFGTALEETVKNESINKRPLVIERSRRLQDLQDCHLLFICKSEARRLDEILGSLGDRPVLLVSETEGFARRGGVIAFYLEGKKVRFEINPASARRRGLKMSSELLGLGRIVGAEVAAGDN